MGRVRQQAVLLECGECEAKTDMPCVHKTTGLPIAGFHKARVWGPRENVLNAQVREADGGESDEEFFAWAARWLGIDATDQYWGEW